MPSLTHISMFSEQKWKRITASEAASIFPYTVEARSGIFMCELCHQYVYFTRPGINERHFGHTQEEDKSCPERTFGPGIDAGCRKEEHDLPIRLKLLPEDYEFELGLLCVPASTLNELQNQTITISPTQDDKLQSFVYRLKERLDENELTYVSIGRTPFLEYWLELDRKSIPAFRCWPARIRGIDPAGTLFDAVSRKKLPYDADVQVGRKYYLLCSNSTLTTSTSVSIERVFSKSISGRYWRLYKISAVAFDEDAARFFLRYHCRLTDQPVSVQPIWPVYTKSPYVIRHNCQEIIFYVRGNVSTACFPSTYHTHIPLGEGGQLEYIPCCSRQQLVSAGHSYKLNDKDFWRRLKYTYLWKEPLQQITETPIISVTNILGETVLPGEADKLPPKRALRISVPYDGSVIIRKKGQIIEKRRAVSGESVEIDQIQFNYDVEVFQGLDLVWAVQYRRKSTQSAIEETKLLLRLKSASGSPVPISHTWGTVIGQLGEYPKIKLWLYQQIRAGFMPLSAYREFKYFIEKLITK